MKRSMRSPSRRALGRRRRLRFGTNHEGERTVLARLLTPRTAGLVVLVAGTVAAATIGGLGSGPATSAPSVARLGPAGGASTSSASSDQQASANGPGPIVTGALHHDLSRPLRTLRPGRVPNTGPQLAPDAGGEHVASPPAVVNDPVAQTKKGSAQVPALSANFEGVGVGQGGSPAYVPPDPNGAPGPNNYYEIVNGAIGIYSKTGSLVYGPAATNTLWSGFGGGCQTNDDGDGTVVYDQFSGRWVVQQFVVRSLPYLECIAVSQTSDPTGAYYRYSFSYGNTDFPDYPKLGVWPDAYYVSYNIFANGQNFTGPEVCALDRASMIAGLAATQQCFKLSSAYFSLLPSSVEGPTPPPSGAPNYLVSLGPNRLNLFKFHVDWTTPTNSNISGPTALAVASYTSPGSIPEPNGSFLDSLGDRLMYPLGYRNFGDHESLVVAHSVVAGSAVGMRWYEIRSPNAAPTVFQQGTYAPDGTYRWMGSVSMDHVGDMALGFATSSSTVRPGAGYTGRLVSDPLGLMGQGEATLVAGSGSQNTYSRWGDYTSMAIDPADDCTFWYLGEYLVSDGVFNWHTRVGSFTFPSCLNNGPPPPTVTSFQPTSGPAGTNVTITGTGFTGATLVTFNATPATFTVNSDTSISATVPTGATTGAISVTTPNGTGTSSTSFVVPTTGNPPVVTSFFPASGPVGSSVAIKGSNFLGTIQVTFNGIPSTNFTVNTSIKITAVVPFGATTGKIAVTNTSGTGTSTKSFVVTSSSGNPPTVSSFSPTSGPVGTPVDIQGANFTGATSVKFNGTADTSFVVNSDSDISAHVPSGATTGTISVTTANGTGTSATSFTVTSSPPPPTVSSFSPTSGPVGTPVDIQGANFTGATSVKFNGTADTSFVVNSDSDISAHVPSGATTGTISVTTANGTGTSATSFTVTSNSGGPTITSFTPTSGRAGRYIYITGTNFTGATKVALVSGSTFPASYNVLSSTSIKAVVPTAAAGFYNWQVTTPAGTALSPTQFQVLP